MKKLSFALMVSCLTTLSTVAGTKIIIYSTGGEPFDMNGVVVSYEGGICRQGNINYELQSWDKRTKVLLSSAGRNKFALRMAMLTHGLYSITGTWQHGVDCEYVEVASVRKD
jgi:hypothetical protein